jgi:hypothetical protein
MHAIGVDALVLFILNLKMEGGFETGAFSILYHREGP